jgi:hypothetical protein
MFFLFGGANFYASGGMNDFLGSFATLDEALAVAVESRADEDGDEVTLEWWQVATFVDGQFMVLESGHNP